MRKNATKVPPDTCSV